jgi:hypothetical protein
MGHTGPDRALLTSAPTIEAGARFHMHRRQFIGGILACGCYTQPAQAERSARFRSGCRVRWSAQESAASARPEYKETTGNARYDGAVKSALASVSRVIGRGIDAKLVFNDEYNAHFSAGDKPQDNIVAFGKALLDRLQASDFALKVTCIAAHEVAHIFQFQDGYFDLAQDDATNRRNELMADYFAGCCLAFIVNGGRRINRGTLDAKKPSVRAAFDLMFSLGDDHFNSPDHHGTKQERRDAVDNGYDFAFEVAGGNPDGDISKDIMDNARFGLR